MIQAFGNDTYNSVAQQVGDFSSVAELVLKLQDVQQKVQHPLVSSKHVGLNLAMFVVDLRFLKRESQDFQNVFINPKIISIKAPLVSGLEDDLSIPRLAVSIERPKQIQVSFLNEQMTENTIWFSDLAARWIQHGAEQLEGISIVDKLNHHRQRSVRMHLKQIVERKVETNYELEYSS